MTEVYSVDKDDVEFDLEDTTREGLLKLVSEAMQMGDTTLQDQAFNRLNEMDRNKCHQKLTELRTEINSLIANNG
jgi:hypothetical protein